MIIKTIVWRLDCAEAFDCAVNEALVDGWELIKRDLVLPNQPSAKERFFHPMLIAELQRDE